VFISAASRCDRFRVMVRVMEWLFENSLGGIWWRPAISLFAPELRTTFGDEGGDPFLRVVGAAGGNDRFFFDLKLIGQTGLE